MGRSGRRHRAPQVAVERFEDRSAPYVAATFADSSQRAKKRHCRLCEVRSRRAKTHQELTAPGEPGEKGSPERSLCFPCAEDATVLAAWKFELQQGGAARSHGFKQPRSLTTRPRPLKHPFRCARRPCRWQGRDEGTAARSNQGTCVARGRQLAAEQSASYYAP